MSGCGIRLNFLTFPSVSDCIDTTIILESQHVIEASLGIIHVNISFSILPFWLWAFRGALG